jgi:hypothetical protein
MNNGDDVVQWEWLNADNFKWSFTPVSVDSTLANGTYNIKAKHSNKMMSVQGWSSSIGAIIEQWDSLCQSNEKFTLQYTSSGYIIKPYYNSKVVSVKNFSVANGAAIVQWDDLAQQHQRFQIVSLGGGYYKIVCRYTNKCLAVTGSGTNNGDDVVQWEWLNYDNFKWAFETPCSGGPITSKQLEPVSNSIFSEKLNVYPNPTTGHFTIYNPANNNQYVELYDMTGKLLLVVQNSDRRRSIDISKLSKGIYTLKILENNTVVVKKIILQ